jgi:hypothetical protein
LESDRDIEEPTSDILSCLDPNSDVETSIQETIERPGTDGDVISSGRGRIPGSRSWTEEVTR